MIKLIYKICTEYSTGALGYWPEAFRVSYDDNFKGFTIIFLVFAGLFFISTALHVIIAGEDRNDIRTYASSKYFIYMFLYTFLSTLFPLIIPFVGWNIAGCYGALLLSLFYFLLILYRVISEGGLSEMMVGAFGLLGYLKLKSKFLGEYEAKISKWNEQYEKKLNF